MAESYARALWKLVEKGMKPKEAVGALARELEARGRADLMPRVGRTFARLAARDRAKNGVTLSIARACDERAAKDASEDALAGMRALPSGVAVLVDDALIGGWRLEGQERLLDASFRRYLLDLYNRIAGA